MKAEHAVQGVRHATLIHIERVTICGKPNHRIVFRFVNDRNAPARETLIRPEQGFRHMRIGMLVRIHFCLSRVLRVERAG